MTDQRAYAKQQQGQQHQGTQQIAGIGLPFGQLPPGQLVGKLARQRLGSKVETGQGKLIAPAFAEAHGALYHLAELRQLLRRPAALGCHGVVEQHRDAELLQTPALITGMHHGAATFVLALKFPLLALLLVVGGSSVFFVGRALRRSVGQGAGNTQAQVVAAAVFTAGFAQQYRAVVETFPGFFHRIEVELGGHLHAKVVGAQHRIKHVPRPLHQLLFELAAVFHLARTQALAHAVGRQLIAEQQAGLVDHRHLAIGHARHAAGHQIDDTFDLGQIRAMAGGHVQHDRGGRRLFGPADKQGALRHGQMNPGLTHPVQSHYGTSQLAFQRMAIATGFHKLAGAHAGIHGQLFESGRQTGFYAL